MVDIDKALMAIEEKEKWEKREDKILEELEEVRERKKELKKETKQLKERIQECENTLRSMDLTDQKKSGIYIDLSEELKRM